MLFRLLALILAVLAVTSCAWGDVSLVSATYQPVSQGYYLRLTLSNSLQQEYLKTLTVSTFYDATNTLSPPGWTNALPPGQVVWAADSASYLQPGQTENRFGFTTQNSPGSIYWSVRSNANNYVGFVTPTLIPEPSSILALAGGLTGLAGLRFRMRKK